MSWLQKLKSGLSKTSSKITTGIAEIFTKRKINEQVLEELEELLISSDIGVETSQYIVKEISKQKYDKEITEHEIRVLISDLVCRILSDFKNPIPDTIPDTFPNTSNLLIIMVCGVNGNGKTTTIGKLAHYYQKMGKTVMMAACDTFRAAACEQLEIWANRNNCQIIKDKEGSDPASIAYKACEEAKSQNIDVLLIDTAGRLHNKSNLMDELSKIYRVVKKFDNNAPHYRLLVLDATTGQNAYNQLEKFKEIIDINSLIVTKLDGTAKAGVIVGLLRKFSTPIMAIGIGESIDDLQEFLPEEFSKKLVGL